MVCAAAAGGVSRVRDGDAAEDLRVEEEEVEVVVVVVVEVKMGVVVVKMGVACESRVQKIAKNTAQLALSSLTSQLPSNVPSMACAKVRLPPSSDCKPHV